MAGSVVEYSGRLGRGSGPGWAEQQRLVAARWAGQQELSSRPLTAHTGCVNALEFSQDGRETAIQCTAV